jgi:hypothetical protein
LDHPSVEVGAPGTEWYGRSATLEQRTFIKLGVEALAVDEKASRRRGGPLSTPSRRRNRQITIAATP